MKKILFLLAFVCSLLTSLNAQIKMRTHVFGHSLINHEHQLIKTPSQETSIPHWMHFLAKEAGHTFEVSGQYGSFVQHINLPPSANWGFDSVKGAWDSENESFGEANFTNILCTPLNFIQWQSPKLNYPNENVSPFGATSTVINWCNDNQDSLVFYIYENWPDMAPYLKNGFPPTATEWTKYNSYLNGDFHDWFLNYHDILMDSMPGICIKMIPVGPILSKLLQKSPFDKIAIDQLYEDDAPHGRASTYFLASMVTYMAMYQEKAPSTYKVDPIIDPIIASNYKAAIDFIWDEINKFKDDNEKSRVFCTNKNTDITKPYAQKGGINIYPNPTTQYLEIIGNLKDKSLHIFSFNGLLINSIEIDSSIIDISSLTEGVYYIEVQDSANTVLFRKKIIKI